VLSLTVNHLNLLLKNRGRGCLLSEVLRRMLEEVTHKKFFICQGFKKKLSQTIAQKTCDSLQSYLNKKGKAASGPANLTVCPIVAT